ncbi:FHA domain-containing protein [Achromobacter aloeverae]
MKLTAIRRTDDLPFAPIEAEFPAPGGTIGRGRENRLVLDETPGALCRVQALVRVGDSACWLANLSDMAGVSINGEPLACEQEAALRHGDEVTIGAYVLHADDAAAMAAAPEPDIFGDLFGPGTLPVGAAPDVSAHPFDMASAAGRNPEDPLAQLGHGDTVFGDKRGDPLAMFPDPDGRHVDHVFTDATPSTLHGEDPLASLRDDPIGGTIGGMTGPRGTPSRPMTDRDDVREPSGHMRPPTVRKDA